MQRKNLETLMGAEAMGTVPEDTKFTDAKVCKNQLCGTCPHELFTNTKMDLGQCPKLHSQKLKDDYESAVADAIQTLSLNGSAPDDGKPPLYSVKELEGLKREYERNIMSFVDECDRRIRAAQRRLEKTPEENNKTTALMREIGEVETAYQLAMQAVEQLGESGQIDESMAELAKAEALKGEKQDKERELQQLTDTSGASGHQKLRVCDICGAYLSILDSDRRLADHFGGKMHLGYLQLRQTIEEWRSRGTDSVRLAAAPEGMKPPPVPVDNPAYAGLHVAGAPLQPSGENGNAPSTNGGFKRPSDLPDGLDGNREREKRRRYD
ncbi:MAG: splicing factor [Cyphobasidiales sp. Tagirdzhanova-0007]|nr:MAG: splicing factor [Cyphobasidiales sp. Tagirdzhanova-0007]